MLRVPGDLPPEDGAATAHGVPHRGDALQGLAWSVPVILLHGVVFSATLLPAFPACLGPPFLWFWHWGLFNVSCSPD